MTEGEKLFRVKFRLPIDHSFDGSPEKKHHHVIEIAIEFVCPEDTELFSSVKGAEQSSKEVLDIYRNKFLNEFEEFGNNTTIENVGEVLFKKLYPLFKEKHRDIIRFEISETPLRVYAIVTETE